MVQPMEGAVVRKTTIVFFYKNRFRVQTPGEVNTLNAFKVSLKWISYTIYTISLPLEERICSL